MKKAKLAAVLILAVSAALLPAAAVTDDQRSFYRKVMEHDGNDEEVLLFTAITEEIEGNYAAIFVFRELQQYYDKHPPKDSACKGWVYAKLAYHECVHGSKSKASEYCNIAMNHFKQVPGPINLSSGFFYMEGEDSLCRALMGLKRIPDYNRCSSLLSSAGMRFGRRPTRRNIRLAALAYILGDYSSASGLCDLAIKEQPGYAGSYYFRAVINRKADHMKQAIKDLNYAITLCPDFSEAFLLRSACYLLDDKKTEALADADKAVETSHSAAAYQIRAAIKLVSHDLDGGMADLVQATKASDADWIAFSMLGDCFLKSREFDKAVDCYTKALSSMDSKVKKNRATAYYRRGLCYYMSGDEAKSKPDFEQAVLLDPSRADQVKAVNTKIDESNEEKFVPASTSAKLNVKEDIDDENYKEYVSSADASLPTFQEGADGEKLAKGSRSRFSKSTISSSENSVRKPGSSFVIESGDSKSEDTGKANSAAASCAGDPKKADTSSAITSSTESSRNAAPASLDPFIKYLEGKISSLIENPASSDQSAQFQIQEDGVAILQNAESKENMLGSTVLRAAPFKAVPAGKPSVFLAEIKSGTRYAKIKYSE